MNSPSSVCALGGVTRRAWISSFIGPRIGLDAEGKPITDQIRPDQLAFPNGQGKVQTLSNIMQRGFMPAQVRAGVAVDTGQKSAKGDPVLKAKYTGIHALRHFYGSPFNTLI